MTNQTQSKAITLMLIYSNDFSVTRKDFYEAGKSRDYKAQVDALGKALVNAHLAIGRCKDAGFEPREVMETTINFIETFGTVEYYDELKARA